MCAAVGIMVKDNVVDNVMTGAPASHCKQIQKGDVVVEIDGTPVTPKNIIELLVGDDVPGTSVTLKLARNSRSDQRTLQVTLKRASTAELADKKKMFQLFTHIKDLATHRRDAETGACVDETIELWSKMVEVDQAHDEQIVKNVEQMQGRAHEAVCRLRALLGQLHQVSSDAISGSGLMAAQQAVMQEQAKAAAHWRQQHQTASAAVEQVRQELCDAKASASAVAREREEEKRKASAAEREREEEKRKAEAQVAEMASHLHQLEAEKATSQARLTQLTEALATAKAEASAMHDELMDAQAPKNALLAEVARTKTQLADAMEQIKEKDALIQVCVCVCSHTSTHAHTHTHTHTHPQSRNLYLHRWTPMSWPRTGRF